MFRPRVLPCLLLKNKGLVKTVKFRNPTYIGDPINAVKIYNDLEADELAFVDITATNDGRLLDIDFVKKIAEEAFMPFAAGGGIRTIEDIRNILKAGAEKVIINSSSVLDPELITRAADLFGNQSIIVSIDAAKGFFGKYAVYIKSGRQKTDMCPVKHAAKMESMGAGEILINSIDRDGMMQGYDIELIKSVSSAVHVPVIAVGGAGCVEHFREAVLSGGASAVAAGSMFVYHGPRKGVLINYPDKLELETAFRGIS